VAVAVPAGGGIEVPESGGGVFVDCNCCGQEPEPGGFCAVDCSGCPCLDGTGSVTVDGTGDPIWDGQTIPIEDYLRLPYDDNCNWHGSNGTINVSFRTQLVTAPEFRCWVLALEQADDSSKIIVWQFHPLPNGCPDFSDLIAANITSNTVGGAPTAVFSCGTPCPDDCTTCPDTLALTIVGGSNAGTYPIHRSPSLSCNYAADAFGGDPIDIQLSCHAAGSDPGGTPTQDQWQISIGTIPTDGLVHTQAHTTPTSSGCPTGLSWVIDSDDSGATSISVT
jgi:hypothetical protein